MEREEDAEREIEMSGSLKNTLSYKKRASLQKKSD